MAMFHLLKIRASVDIFKNEKCKVTFGLEYMMGRSPRCYIPSFVDSGEVVFKGLLQYMRMAAILVM